MQAPGSTAWTHFFVVTSNTSLQIALELFHILASIDCGPHTDMNQLLITSIEAVYRPLSGMAEMEEMHEVFAGHIRPSLSPLDSKYPAHSPQATSIGLHISNAEQSAFLCFQFATSSLSIQSPVSQA